jgi:hypothetical protein
MTKEYEQSLDQRWQSTVKELEDLGRQHYPETSFANEPGFDDPETTHIVATVDLDDPDEVVDLVIDRMLELQLDEGIPVYVIPIRTPERVAKLSKQLREERLRPSFPPAPLV